MINSLSSFFDEHEALANNILVAFVLACVQTFPPPSEKNREKSLFSRFFLREGGRLYTGYFCFILNLILSKEELQ